MGMFVLKKMEWLQVYHLYMSYLNWIETQHKKRMHEHASRTFWHYNYTSLSRNLEISNWFQKKRRCGIVEQIAAFCMNGNWRPHMSTPTQLGQLHNKYIPISLVLDNNLYEPLRLLQPNTLWGLSKHCWLFYFYFLIFFLSNSLG